MNLHLDTERETDGRWLAEVLELPGALTYGPTRRAALAAAKVLALQVLADRLDSGALRADDLVDIHFATGAER